MSPKHGDIARALSRSTRRRSPVRPARPVPLRSTRIERSVVSDFEERISQMRSRLGFAAGVAAGILIGVLCVGGLGGPASARQDEPSRSDAPDNQELIKLYAED